MGSSFGSWATILEVFLCDNVRKSSLLILKGGNHRYWKRNAFLDFSLHITNCIQTPTLDIDYSGIFYLLYQWIFLGCGQYGPYWVCIVGCWVVGCHTHIFLITSMHILIAISLQCFDRESWRCKFKKFWVDINITKTSRNMWGGGQILYSKIHGVPKRFCQTQVFLDCSISAWNSPLKMFW